MLMLRSSCRRTRPSTGAGFDTRRYITGSLTGRRVSADKSPVGRRYTAAVVRQSPPTLNALSGFWAGRRSGADLRTAPVVDCERRLAHPASRTGCPDRRCRPGGWRPWYQSSATVMTSSREGASPGWGWGGADGWGWGAVIDRATGALIERLSREFEPLVRIPR